METFFIYILKSAVCLACFYLFYRFLLSKETFHRFNRIVLMGILLLPFVLPLVELPVELQQVKVNQTVAALGQTFVVEDVAVATDMVDASQSIPFPWLQFMWVIYWAGVFFFVCRNLYSMTRMYFLLKSGSSEKIGKHTTLILHEWEIAPFSWMKYIVISHKDFQENGREIMLHERAHIQNRHSWDLLVVDLCLYLQWFNPAAWSLKHELQNVHEYEADACVLREGTDVKQYQLLLIQKAVGGRIYSMVSNFNHTELKKRIAMMLKEKSNSLARLKCLYVLPLAALTLVTFACANSNGNASSVSAAPVENSVVADVVVEEVVSDTVSTFNPKMFLDRLIKEKKNLAVIVIMDNKEVKPSVLLNLPEERVRTARLMKPLDAKQKYGNKAKDGVIVVTTFSATKITVKGVVQNEKGLPLEDALIFQEGSNAAMVTNEKGEFTREVPEKTKLTISAQGYVKQEVNPSPELTIRMQKKQ